MAYRQLDLLILGANPEKLAARRRLEVTVNVIDHNGQWMANTAQVKGLLFRAAMRGGQIQAQRTDTGDWVRISNYKTVKGQAYGCSLASGVWLEVQAVREVL